jgi:polyhydroxybutyrate depolymerase
MLRRMRRSILPGVVLLLASCGRPSTNGSSGAPHETIFDLAGDPTAHVEVAPAKTELARVVTDPCSAPSSLVTGPRDLLVDGGATIRTVYVDAPPIDPSQPNAPRPLLLAYHGWGGDPEQLERTTRIASTALARGYVVVRPLGVGKSFNAGTCCGDASDAAIDDVGFARALVASISSETCIDRRRVFVTGFSNGGFLAHRLACESADVFAAVASVAGTFGIDACAPSRPVSVLQIHGKIDHIVKFGGDEKNKWSSVATVIDAWVRANRCKIDGAREVFAHGNARCVRSGDCEGDAEVTLCRDDRAGHTWPGGPRSTGPGGSQDLDATGFILDFFARHPMP